MSVEDRARKHSMGPSITGVPLGDSDLIAFARQEIERVRAAVAKSYCLLCKEDVAMSNDMPGYHTPDNGGHFFICESIVVRSHIDAATSEDR